MINTRHNSRLLSLQFVISYANHVSGLSCRVFACLGFVVSSVCLSRVCDGTKLKALEYHITCCKDVSHQKMQLYCQNFSQKLIVHSNINYFLIINNKDLSICYALYMC